MSSIAASPSFIYLASASPRRRQLLDQLGVRHELLLPGADEDAEAIEAVRRGEAPQAYAERVTLAKLEAARARLALRGLEAAPILCADTTVALGRRILGKPADAAEAAAMLAALAGRSHRVITALALAIDTGQGRRTLRATQVSRVQMAPMTARDIERYVASGEPFGKAGAYAIQGPIGAFVERIAGSYTGIMGLPLYETEGLLRQARIRCKTF